MSKNHANIHNGKSLIQLFTSIKYNCMPNNWISIDGKIEKRPPHKGSLWEAGGGDFNTNHLLQQCRDKGYSL